MILSEIEVRERLESPMNLLNRLKSISSQRTTIPSLPPSSSEIINNLQEKIAFGSIKSKAAGIMSSAMDELKARLPEVQKPERLAQIAAEMSKVINGSQVKNEDNSTKIGQVIIYAPQILPEEAFEIIRVNE